MVFIISKGKKCAALQKNGNTRRKRIDCCRVFAAIRPVFVNNV
jgi:hypothetical protein